MAHFSWDRGPSKGPSYKSLTMLYVQCEKMGRIMVEEKFKWLLHNIGDYFPFKTSSQVWWAKEKEFVPLHVPTNWWRLCKFFLFFGLMLKFKPDLELVVVVGLVNTTSSSLGQKSGEQPWDVVLAPSLGTLVWVQIQYTMKAWWWCGCHPTAPRCSMPFQKDGGHNKMLCHMHGCKGPGWHGSILVLLHEHVELADLISSSSYVWQPHEWIDMRR